MAQTLNTPQVLNQPIANNGDKNVIPNTNDQSTGLMSMSAGFPPVTSQRIADGGIPPRRSDVNGALNLISQQHYFLQNGGTYTFRQDVSNAIGGYPKNAILYYEDPDGNLTLVRSLVENNTNNFINDPSLIDGVNWERLSLGIANANIGQIIQVACAPDYTPFGTLPCDGSQYSASKFPTLWQNYLTADTPLLNTCTLEEWEAEVSSNGQCLKFAIDTTNNVFKVPLIKDGTHLQQALTDDELSKFYSDGLPVLDLSTVGAHTHTRGTMNITGGPIHINAYGPGNITSGAFRTVATGASHNDSGGTGVDIYFNAENAWTGATSSNGNHTHTFTSSKVGKYNTVQPVSFGIRFFVVVANAVRNESMMDWSQWQSDLQGKANIDLSNLSALGEKHFLNYNQVTNCLIEISQDINLELNNGTLTLKAGSKVYVPNGFEADGTTPKFDVIVINNDITHQQSANGEITVYYNLTGNQMISFYSDADDSGSTVPTYSKTFYNTSTNKLSRYEGGATDDRVFSFPLARVTVSSGAISSIDQVFNGFGYIGSTVFALPGIRGLSPNGRNADGSLKNIEFTIPNVVTRTFSSSDNFKYAGFGINALTFVFGRDDINIITYNKEENYIYDGSNVWWNQCICGSFTLTNGVISNFNLKTTFQAVDRNDTSWLSGLGAPSNRYIDLTLGASQSTYTAPAYGYYYIRLIGTAGNYFYLRNRSASYIADGGTFGARAMDASVRVRKGDAVYVSYNGTISTVEVFRFIYAEGETE